MLSIALRSRASFRSLSARYVHHSGLPLIDTAYRTPKSSSLLTIRKLASTPTEYIVGEGKFRDIKLKTVPPIFIPEPQTALIVDLALAHISRRSSKVSKVLEIGCGTGAISLAILHCSAKVESVAIDRNIKACELALENANRLGVSKRITILHAALEEDGHIRTATDAYNTAKIDLEKEEFDFIVSNPPYTPIDDVPKWQKEGEDFRARDGGADGLSIIRPLLHYASRRLKKDSVLLLEIYPTQPLEIKRTVEQQYPSVFKFDHVFKDFRNDDRFVQITKIA